MVTVVVVCPYCGQWVESRYEDDADFDGVRQRLKSEYCVARQTCSICSNPYNLRRAQSVPAARR